MTEPVGFWSYTRHDDGHADGQLSQLRRVVGNQIDLLCGADVRLFQDVDSIPAGSDWQERIDEAIGCSNFFIPIVTPRFLKSDNCYQEFSAFRGRMASLGRDDLIFPVLYVPIAHVDEGDTRFGADLRELTRHQMVDFTPLIDFELKSPEVRRWARAFAESILTSVTRPAPISRPAQPAAAPPPPSPAPQQTAAISWTSAAGNDRFGAWAELTVGGVTQRLRRILPGRFLMGAPGGEDGRYPDEGPIHTVKVGEAYWIFDTPCTQALWQAVMGSNPSRFQTPDRPVERVSFDDVAAFLDKLNAIVPGFALPTEAQWEYACRAGTRAATYAGDLRIAGLNNAPVLDPIAWYGGNSGVGFELGSGCDSSDWPEKQFPHKSTGTRPVGLKAPNPWGLYDMLGNVWEWCGDNWHPNYKGAPADGSAWLEANATNHVLRGGSWFDVAHYIRAAYRVLGEPSLRDDIVGFRCVRGQ